MSGNASYNVAYHITDKSIRHIDDYLADNEVQPKPLSELITDFTDIEKYVSQMIVNAPFWKQDARLAVGSILLDQPLRAQGATDANLFLCSSDNFDDFEIGDNIKIVFLEMVGAHKTNLYYMQIEGDWKVVDVNRSAMEAHERMGARELKLDEQWLHLYNFVRAVASDGFGVSLNQIQHNEGISPAALSDLISAERNLVRKAVDALNIFEGSNQEIDRTMRGLPTDDEVRNASHLGVRGDE